MNCFSIEQNFENWLIDWLMDERFYVKKTELKGNAVDNYWHLLFTITVKTFGRLYLWTFVSFFRRREDITRRTKGLKRNSRGSKDQLLLDKAVLRDCKRISTNLAMDWIDCRKSCDMIPQSWISECREVFEVAENTKNFLVNSMNKWKL